MLHNAGWRTLQEGDSQRTGLKKYLVAESNAGGDGFANILAPVSGLYAEAMALTNNVSIYGLPTSIGIDDTFTNVNITADRLRQMANIGYEMFSFEMLHMTQGAQIRRDEQGLALGEGTQKLLAEYRKVVPFVDKDRIFTHDVNNGVKFLKQFDLDRLR